MDTTVFVLVTDHKYFPKAKTTIRDIRSRGEWHGDIVMIAIDFHANQNFLDFYQIQQKRFTHIQEKKDLCNILNYCPFSDTIDGREISKPNQWEKLHVFDPFFKQWNRVVFVDAGLRILHNVHESFLKLDYKNAFLAPDDGGNYVSLPNPDKLFKTQVSHGCQQRLRDSLEPFGGLDILEKNYFLNCVWVYDTAILDTCTKQEMINGIVNYPICKTNEMTMMNLFLHFKYKLWKPFPVHVPNTTHKKILFDWCELNNPSPSTWCDYCLIKYPCTISMEDT
jgi:hypothetical protein